MSGHNKWSTIKHKKAAEDSKRGKIFTKLIKEIMIAARDGGGDPESNPRLRTAVRSAHTANMPKDNVERAIKKGTGELEGTRFEEITYEGYGPGGVAVFIQTLSDNRNRITAEIRHLFGRYNGNMGESGCVAWMFQKKGYISISGADLDEDKVLETALEAGAEDVKSDKGSFEVFTAPNDLEPVREALIAAGVPVQSADITMIPKTTVKLDEAKARTMLKLLDAIEDLEDVQNVYANFDIDASVMETIAAA